MTVALAREGKTGGKLKFWVAEVNAEGKLASTSTQRIKLTLTPTLDAAGALEAKSIEAGAVCLSVYVGGDAVAGER